MSDTHDCKTCSVRLLGVFCHLDLSSLGDLDRYKTHKTCQKGELIFHEGEKPSGLYCLFRGRVKLYKSIASGSQQILRMAGPGDLLGYRSLFAGENYHTSAEVMESSELCYIDSKAFFSILSKNPQLAFELMRKLAKELRAAENLAVNITHKSARERMAELLLMLKESYGTPVKKGLRISLQLSRQEMAEMIGSTQETSIRLLSDFRREGIIEVEERNITIRDLNALLDAASLDN